MHERGLAVRQITSQTAQLVGFAAGGLLVGACVTMEPRQFKAAVAEVPFLVDARD